MPCLFNAFSRLYSPEHSSICLFSGTLSTTSAACFLVRCLLVYPLRMGTVSRLNHISDIVLPWAFSAKKKAAALSEEAQGVKSEYIKD